MARQCYTVEEIHDKLKEIFKDTLQEVFEAEIDHHLGYKKHSSEGDNCGNSRNGYSNKQIKTRFGKMEIDIPRDRNGEFEPQIIKKYEKISNQLEDQIIAMYAKGMSTRDIEEHMKDIYDLDVSPALVSRITDKLIPMIAQWQARPLERIYPIVFLDAIHFKVRNENRIVRLIRSWASIFPV